MGKSSSCYTRQCCEFKSYSNSHFLTIAGIPNCPIVNGLPSRLSLNNNSTLHGTASVLLQPRLVTLLHHSLSIDTDVDNVQALYSCMTHDA